MFGDRVNDDRLPGKMALSIALFAPDHERSTEVAVSAGGLYQGRDETVSDPPTYRTAQISSA
jgi:hypothetical protein